MYQPIDIPNSTFPLLAHLEKTPQLLRSLGEPPTPDTTLLAVVGSRAHTAYGKECVRRLVNGLRGAPIAIVSGLALGIDALAHDAALSAGLHTIAIPGSGLGERVLYPRTNRPLARRILAEGGMLLSPFPDEQAAAPWSFPVRNRLIAGIAHATLVIEASERSGTLITAQFARQYGRTVLAVPGSIFGDTTRGTHELIRSGATMVRDAADICTALNITVRHEAPRSVHPTNSPEATLITCIRREPTSRDALIRTLAATHTLDTASASVILMQLELAGEIHEVGGVLCAR